MGSRPFVDPIRINAEPQSKWAHACDGVKKPNENNNTAISPTMPNELRSGTMCAQSVCYEITWSNESTEIAIFIAIEDMATVFL